MARKFSNYKYVKLEGKGWRYKRAAYYPNGKIIPNVVLVKHANGRLVEEKHLEGSYFLYLNNTWIPIMTTRGDVDRQPGNYAGSARSVGKDCRFLLNTC